MEYNKVIDGYELQEEESKNLEREQKLKDITIIYLCNNEYFAESKYKKISEEKVERIRKQLDDNTRYNSTVEFQCQAIALPTLIFLIEDIIKNY